MRRWGCSAGRVVEVATPRESWGSTAKWRKVRQRVFQRDDGLCQLRGPNCTGRATEVHHRYGRLTPGQPLNESDYDLNQLIATCRTCNRDAGRPTGDPLPRSNTVW